jgi:hypothetical protein
MTPNALKVSYRSFSSTSCKEYQDNEKVKISDLDCVSKHNSDRI